MASRIDYSQNRKLYVGTTAEVSVADGNAIIAGNVGIGTTGPLTKLHVFEAGTAMIRVDSGATSPYKAGIEFLRSSINGGRIYNDGGAVQVKLESDSAYDAANPTRGGFMFKTAPVTSATLVDAVRIDARGYVGIGTTSPDFKLDVETLSTGNQTIASFKTNESTYNGLLIAANNNAGWIGNGTITADEGILFQDTTSATRFYTNSAERMRIDSSGNVGIGTDSPTEISSGATTLEISGTVTTKSGALRLASSDNSLSSYFYHQSSGLLMGTATAQPIRIITNNSEKIRIESGGNVGIGTTSPGAKLDVLVGGTNHIQLGASALGNTGDYIGGLYYYSNKLLMESFLVGTGYQDILLSPNGGNVGIGTTAPVGNLFVGPTWSQTGGNNLYIKSQTTTTSYDPSVNATQDLGITYNTSSTATTGPDKTGLVLHNDAGVAGQFSPMIIFSGKEATPSQYKAAMAGIYARSPLGTGNLNDYIDGELIFATAGAATKGIVQRMVINKEGNVGIGTTNPQTKLHVEGLTRITEGGNTAFYSGNYVRLFNSQAYQFRNSGGSVIANIDLSGDSYFNGGNVGIGTTGPSYLLDVNGDARSKHFRDNAQGSGSTPATIGWYKIAKWDGSARGGSEIKISTTGGTYTPITWIIRCYKNWSGDATLKLEQYGYSNIYFTKARVEYDNAAAVYYLEIYQSIATALAFNMYQTSLMGFNANVSILTGALAAGTTGGTTRTELPFIAGGTSVEALTIGNSGNTGPYLPLAGGTMDNNASVNMNSGQLTSVDFIDFGIAQLNGESTSIFQIKSLGDIYYNVDSNNNGNSSHIFQESGSELMRIRYDGNVGIGTTSPSTKLEVVDTFSVQRTSADNEGLYVTVSGSDANAIIESFYQEDGNSLFGYRKKYDGSTNLYQEFIHDNSATGTEVYRVARDTKNTSIANGNVGIGTTNPRSTLEVDGQVLISNTFPALDFVDTNSFTDVNDRFRVRAGGNQGLMQWYDDSNSSLLTLMTLNPNGDVIVPNGNVGIGTTSPSAKLDVAGTGNFTGLVSGITPVAAANFVTKAYVDGSGGGTGPFLPLAGGTMTGDILMDGKAGIGNVISLATGTSTNAPSLRLYTYNSIDPGGGLGTSTGNMIQADLGSALVLRQTADDADIIFQNDDGSGGVETYFFLDGSLKLNRFLTDTLYNDNVEARFGTSTDLKIFHNSTNSYIQNTTGNLYLSNNAPGADVVFQGPAGFGTNTATYFFLDGSQAIYPNGSPGKQITTFPDHSRLTFGTGNDLQIYHDGSNSYIQDTSGTGDLRVDTSTFRLRSANGGETMIRAFEDGAVILSHNNFDKLFTTSTGVSVTGEGIFTGNVGIGATNPGTTRLQVTKAASGPVAKFDNTSGTGGTGLEVNGGNGTGFALSVGSYTGNEKFRVQGNGNVGIGTSSPATQLEISNINDNPATLRLSSDLADGDLVGAIISFSNDAGGGGVQGRIENVSTEDDTTVFKFYTDNTSSPSMTLFDSGNMTIAGTLTQNSDVRLKENIKPIESALDKVKQMQGVEFNKINSSTKEIGVVAQEIEKIIPELVLEDKEGIKSVAYGNITAVLIEAIKEQQKQIEELKQQLNK